MRVWMVFTQNEDTLLSVHDSEGGAENRSAKLNREADENPGKSHTYVSDREVEGHECQ